MTRYFRNKNPKFKWIIGINKWGTFYFNENLEVVMLQPGQVSLKKATKCVAEGHWVRCSRPKQNQTSKQNEHTKLRP